MESNEIERRQFAVACSLSKQPDGRIQLVLDDIRNLAPQSAGGWSHHVFVTSKEYEQSQLSALDLPDEEFAALGHYVVARLLAANRLLALKPE